MNNKICNPKTEVPTGIDLNDKDYLENLLTNLKWLSKNMVVVLTECSNEYLFKEYQKIFDNIIKYQREVFELMFKLGWYSLEKAPTTKVNEKLKMLNQEFQSLK